MEQATINILLALLVAVMPVITVVIQRIFSKNRDTAEYSTDLLKIANDATEALRKAREELTIAQDQHEETMDITRKHYDASMSAMRSDYDGRHSRLKARIEELEKIQRVYMIQLELSTHPNVEIKNIHAEALNEGGEQEQKITGSVEDKTDPKIQALSPTDQIDQS